MGRLEVRDDRDMWGPAANGWREREEVERAGGRDGLEVRS
jgi:hypothetical protein